MQLQPTHHSTQVVSYLLPLVALSLLAVLKFLLRLQLLLSAHYASEQLSPYQPENNYSITRAGWVGAQVLMMLFLEKSTTYLTCAVTLRDMISAPPSLHLSFGSSFVYLHIVLPSPYKAGLHCFGSYV